MSAFGRLSRDIAPGLCSPVVISAILSLAAVYIAYNGKARAEQAGQVPPKESMGVQQVALGGFLTTAFLWALCYYKFEGAAWFFLLVPMILGGLEINAILNAYTELVMASRQ